MAAHILARCPGCGTLNRAPSDRAGARARCGQCGSGFTVPLTNAPLDVTDASFEGEVKASASPVLIEFWSPGCGHCTRMEGVVGELARELSGRVKVARLDISANPRTAALYEIRGTPAFVLIDKGVERRRALGAMPKDELL
ncbi:MAG TPA: thioredoxin domain-containing protein, partial [Nitrospirota bacterium]|nr:thioredoxin domain-containing protein [Nitrospirota bacterium]